MVKIALGALAKVPVPLKESILRTKTEYRKLGNCGLRVSNPILGGLSLGSSKWLPWVIDEDKALTILKAAYDRGINTWDTANAYSNGESERIMGKALQRFGIPRDKVIIMTKCYRVVCDEENFDISSRVVMHHEMAGRSKDYVNHWGLSRGAIFKAVEDSLKRLNTDYIDVLQIHRFDETVPPEETMRALNDLVRANLVRYLGASSMWTYQFATLQHVAEKHGLTKFVSMQNHYNLLYREEEREMNRYCNETGVALLPWAPLAHGRLARDPQTAPSTLRSSDSKNGALYDQDEGSSHAIISRVQDIAERRGWPMSHVSLAWLNKKVTAPIVGFSSVQRIEEALGAVGKELTAEEEAYLEELYIPQRIQGHE
ncbi:NADP-dependent oxidoreductase domain-containing protein [Stachybotrys elegans]|uniref:NADP-dependent oxidoreductase domain-containing protein n=1 Tax=Stachybotrys elegans TaxID=80388 RepID=A0A8K0T1R7_9HYPO|nr:NADP-dependent oxidoreductase domain-containing protein [Stachybotrys elegans]